MNDVIDKPDPQTPEVAEAKARLKKGMRSTVEVDSELAFQARLRSIGLARGEKRPVHRDMNALLDERLDITAP